jgi:hypothetical protein
MSPNDWVALVGGVLGITVVIVGSLMWYIRVIVRDEVLKATRPIQPGYRNGGESLADIADTVKRIAKHVGLDD